MDESFEALIERFLAEYLAERPVMASSLGVTEHDDRLDDVSADGFARREDQARYWVERMSAVPDAELDLDQRIDRDLVISSMQGQLVTAEWRGWRRDPGTYTAVPLSGVFTLFLNRLHPEPVLAELAEARLRRAPAVLAEAAENLDPSLAHPLIVERALGQCRAGIAYCRSAAGELADRDLRARVADAGEIAAAAYEELSEVLGKLRADASGDYAIGEERYTALLEQKEMLGYGAREMREHGRREYAALSLDMTERAAELRGTDDWRAVTEGLGDDAPASFEEMRDLYAEWTERARAFLISEALVTMPEGERCVVEPSPPFQRPVLAVASYQSPPAFKPSLTGHFFVPWPPEGVSDEDARLRLRTNNRATIPTVSVHEAYPGHHWHAVIRQQAPRPVRMVLGSSYFAEGWALYAEAMMREEGFYDDPRHELMVSDARLFRAARIIVDTSLHIGDMEVEEAVAFMREKASLSEPTARAEVARYCAWPTQASSYLTGALEIERIRRELAPKDRHELRAFHDRIAGSGALPLGLAERALRAGVA